MTINDSVIENIIENKSIKTDFQPIYSLNTNKIIGIEALSRGIYENEVVSPFFLFKYAYEHNCTLAFDRLCREKAMSSFAKQDVAPTLFMNFETSVLNDVVPGNGEIMNIAHENNLKPENIVIELNESHVKDVYQLLMFIDIYRSLGFIIALDNVGAGLETQNKIMLINPDIIKIDRAIISNIDKNTYNQEVFKSLINLAKKIGALTIAEGVETVDEVITCILMGVDYFQGFFFSKPEQINDLYSNEIRFKFDEAAKTLNLCTKNNATVENIKVESYKRILDHLIQKLKNISKEDYTRVLAEHVSKHNELECAFLIDERGFQITPTVMAKDAVVMDGYLPALMGDNHDIKNYFYAIREGIEDPFISGWYTSGATGTQCKTLSSHFHDENGKMIIVCIDLKK